MNLPVCGRAGRSTRQHRPQMKGLMLVLAAHHGADDIGQPEGLAALGAGVAVVAAVQIQGLDVEGSRRRGIPNCDAIPRGVRQTKPGGVLLGGCDHPADWRARGDVMSR